MALDLFVLDEPTDNSEDGFVTAEEALETASEIDYSDMPDLIDISDDERDFLDERDASPEESDDDDYFGLRYIRRHSFPSSRF